MDIYIRSLVHSDLLKIISSDVLSSPAITGTGGNTVPCRIVDQYIGSDGKYCTLIDAKELRHWSPDSPELYTLHTGNDAIRFGCCELSASGNRDILLNGSPCFLRGYIRGIIAHEHPNMTGGSLKDAAVKNIRQAKKYGFNLVRFHSTIPSPEFVEAADEEGMFIHMEIGFAYEYDEQGQKTGIAMNNTAWENAILRYRNHPSIAIFCIGNEMHNSGHHPEVAALYRRGKDLAPGKLIMDNSGWGEFDRESADIFSQHIAYYFPFKHHQDMFKSDACWHLNGSAYDVPMQEEKISGKVSVSIRREATPLRPVIAHEAIHYIDIPDYEALNEKFDKFFASCSKQYLEDNGIVKPRYLTELPELIRKKGLKNKMPDYISGSQFFKKRAIKTYLERLRMSQLCGFEMLQFADCLKYENKNGIVDFFDDDKYIDPAWMMNFNGDAALLADFGNEVFYRDEPVEMALFVSNFLTDPVRQGKVTVKVNEQIVWVGEKVSLAGKLQKIAGLTLRFAPADKTEKVTVSAEFAGQDLHLTNSWDLWLYNRPQLQRTPHLSLKDTALASYIRSFNAPADEKITLTDTLDDALLEKLDAGKHVILLYHRDKPDNQYYLPGALERFKPCIWDRGSNLGGFVNSQFLAEILGTERYFDLNFQPLLEGAYKVILDKCPLPVKEIICGIDKPVRDRMKGLIHGVKNFIAEDTLRNFSHCFAVNFTNGATLTVCTLMGSSWQKNAVTENMIAALLNHPREFTGSTAIDTAELKKYLTGTTAADRITEDVMNHFWEIDNKPVEDTLFWEATGIDLRKLE